MPFALFLISVLVSSSMYLSTSRVAQDSLVNQQLVAGTAAFYVAESSAQVTWGELDTETSSELVQDFLDISTDSGVAVKTAKDFVTEMNSGIEAKRVKAERNTSSSSHRNNFEPQMMFDSGSEFFFYRVKDVPELSFTDFSIDYCIEDQPCPDYLVIEWYEFEQDFNFHDLLAVQDDLYDDVIHQNIISGTPGFDPCYDPPGAKNIKVTKCIAHLITTLSIYDGEFGLSSGQAADNFSWLHNFRLSMSFPGKHYLVRFKSEDGSDFYFQAYGLRNTSVLSNPSPMYPLPNVFMEIDEMGNARGALKRIKEQMKSFGSIQSGLDYVS